MEKYFDNPIHIPEWARGGKTIRVFPPYRQRRRGGRGSPGRDFVPGTTRRRMEKHFDNPIHIPEREQLAHYRSTSARALQTSIFVRTPRITSLVKSLVDAWPPRSAVRMPSDTASSADS